MKNIDILCCALVFKFRTQSRIRNSVLPRETSSSGYIKSLNYFQVEKENVSFCEYSENDKKLQCFYC